ncbi:MAG: hypothetical protein QF903_15625 [Planctomycetota bacterium]|jgi:hypothetical protein|nr:hypothetical protein [Planctomycetota bacterium]MDP6763101.1 hypothetical protein [Planctomycetota bacterium]MDP6990899.1 hypothetical protein [Planctomycetota bacterium]
MSVESEEDGIPETVLLAEGGLNALREMRALLRKHGLDARIVAPPEAEGGG